MLDSETPVTISEKTPGFPKVSFSSISIYPVDGVIGNNTADAFFDFIVG